MDKTDKFEWIVGGEQVYPIDYTQEELRKENSDTIAMIHPDYIKERTVNQEWYENFWKEISYTNADGLKINEKITARILIETWEFFAAYVLIAQIEKRGLMGQRIHLIFLFM